jgi:hypothetical protein
MNMLVERGRVPIEPANDETISGPAAHGSLSKSTAQASEVHEDVSSMPDIVSEFAEFEEYEALRKEAFAIHVMDWQHNQLEVAAKMGMGPPRSL